MLPTPQDKPMATIKLPPPAVTPFSAKNLPAKPALTPEPQVGNVLPTEPSAPATKKAVAFADKLEVKAATVTLDSPPTLLPAKAMEDDLDAEMTEDEKPVSKGKKNPRFGRNPDGTPAAKAPKKDVVRKSPWGIFLHQYKEEHPDLYPQEATIEARKHYKPKSGKEKSFERLFTEVWKQRNPKWPKMTKEDRAAAIRADFIKAI